MLAMFSSTVAERFFQERHKAAYALNQPRPYLQARWRDKGIMVMIFATVPERSKWIRENPEFHEVSRGTVQWKHPRPWVDPEERHPLRRRSFFLPLLRIDF